MSSHFFYLQNLNDETKNSIKETKIRSKSKFSGIFELACHYSKMILKHAKKMYADQHAINGSIIFKKIFEKKSCQLFIMLSKSF